MFEETGVGVDELGGGLDAVPLAKVLAEARLEMLAGPQRR
jgi:hypothetical protein